MSKIEIGDEVRIKTSRSWRKVSIIDGEIKEEKKIHLKAGATTKVLNVIGDDFLLILEGIDGLILAKDVEKVEQTKNYYNGNVICVASQDKLTLTVGKMYTVKDGHMVNNSGKVFSPRFESIEMINNWFGQIQNLAKFVEVKNPEMYYGYTGKIVCTKNDNNKTFLGFVKTNELIEAIKLFKGKNMSKKYVRKSSVIEAVKYDGDFIGSDGEPYVPNWVMKALESGKLFYAPIGDAPPELFIRSGKNAAYRININDYIVMSSDGSIISYAQNVFEQIFKEIDE